MREETILLPGMGRAYSANPSGAPQPGDLTAELIETDWWTDEGLTKEGVPVVDVPFVSVGGGIGSFVTVDYLRICGVPTSSIRVLTQLEHPWESYEYLTRVSQIPRQERLRSDSASCPDNIWGFPSYAVREAIQVGREGDLPVQISHVKAAGRPNWGKVADALGLIDEARAEGLDVMADVYPYTASSTTLRTLLPDWALEGGIDAMLKRLADPEDRARIRRDIEAPETGQGLLDRIGWENVMVASCGRRKDAEGKRISEIAASRGVDPLDAAIELIVAEGGKGYMILFQLDERDLRRALTHPAVMIGSDGSALAPYGELAVGKPHPRSYGTFPRVLGEYAREQRVLSLPQAIHKMTALPARRLGLKDRGVVAVGARADLVVFDSRRVSDRATYQDPHQYPAGIEHVLVNGTFVIKDGEHTGSLPGRLLTPP